MLFQKWCFYIKVITIVNILKSTLPELLLENPNEFTPTKNEIKQDKAYNKKMNKKQKGK